MTIANNENIDDKLCSWIGNSKDSNWTEYSTQLVAKTVLVDFQPPHWERLEEEILTRPEYWQQRCAVSLGEDRSDSAIRILKLLLSNSIYQDVQIIAIYQLDWADVAIEKKYSQIIKKIIEVLPDNEVEPELHSLLKKAESAE